MAVWPDWNVNGQFVVYDVKPGETLKVWRGEASSQVKEGIENRHLEGGWEQIVFKIDRKDSRNDSTRFYRKNSIGKNITQESISQTDYYKLTESEKAQYLEIRQKINHPNIRGPFETGWGYNDFNSVGLMDKIGLPALPGQLTTISR